MQATQRRGKACPTCQSHDTRRSSATHLENLLRFLLLRPFRCRRCRTRFWRIA